MTLCPWRWTPGKVAPQRLGVACHLSIPPLTSRFFISGLSSGFRAPLRIPRKPFLIVLSVINLFGTDSILLQPAHVCFHLPPCLLPSSFALPHRMPKSQWAGYKNMKSVSEEERNSLSGLALFSYFLPFCAFSHLILASLPHFCSHPSLFTNPKGHRNFWFPINLFEVERTDCHVSHKASWPGGESKRILLRGTVWAFHSERTHRPSFARG